MLVIVARINNEHEGKYFAPKKELKDGKRLDIRGKRRMKRLSFKTQ